MQNYVKVSQLAILSVLNSLISRFFSFNHDANTLVGGSSCVGKLPTDELRPTIQ